MLRFQFAFKTTNNLRHSLKLFISREMNTDISEIRAHYRDPNEVFDIKDLVSRDPIKQFENWFKYVRENKLSKEPNAVCLATASKEGRPSNRLVLLKDFSDKGFKFFTNYNSKKGKDLEENPYASMCFYWETLSRQVRIEGRVEKISADESADYFSKRPFNSRVSAYISDQSTVIPDKQYLVDKQQDAVKQFGESQTVPKPEHWGGYLLIPDEFEFWQGNDIRLHDRLRFRRPRDNEKLENAEKDGKIMGENGWIIERLAP